MVLTTFGVVANYPNGGVWYGEGGIAGLNIGYICILSVAESCLSFNSVLPSSLA